MVGDAPEDEFDEDEDDRKRLTVEELDAEHERLTASWSPLDRFAARVGIVESLSAVGTDRHSTALGKYDVAREVARGGMGVVFEALDRELDRTVALKLWYEPTGAPDEKIRREAMNLARLNHPNVVVVHEVDRVDDLFYMAMEFVQGSDLRARLAEPFEWREAVGLFIEAGRGLAAAHEAGLVHGDFKPENVLVGDDGRVRVADFGVARALWTDGGDRGRDARPADRPSSDSPVGGTPAYMAPERLADQRGDPRSDQFSFCVALWEVIFGQRPFVGQTDLALWLAITEGQPDTPADVSGIPERLVAALRRGLASRPAERFPGMGELLDELGDCLREPERELRRRKARIMVVTSVCVGLAIGATVMGLATRYVDLDPETVAAKGSSQRGLGVEDSEPPPFASSDEVIAAFSEWQAMEPDDPSLEFTERGVALAADMERSAVAFMKAGDRPSAASTLMLTKIIFHYASRHYAGLGLVEAEFKVRSREIAALRIIDELTGGSHSAEIATLEAEQAELEKAGR
ncbi:Serine/threonine-protein kinase PK-1 [Enhygromyxa salina]|uniref:Serine/threonine-protein kinase PK-1 n=1 Tax=Enhygromyxa salina TaxID=215803 RepID=A0A2S9YCA2_9BACT|nr:serine/threonine-protein kinase [Enhygromyxa salina]PRQ02744.1 Serine/threonine-protein kinase PK-1 [Enhygromyxa salina]